MGETSGSPTISTKLDRIARLARDAPDMVLTTLAHLIDVEWLREAFRRTRKDGAPGIDGVTADEYEQDLDARLRSLLERARSGSYRAPPVRRVYIPKGDGKQTRPLGIPTLEDKILQRAVAMVLEAVYEQEFFEGSYGFRPGRSAHQALDAVRDTLMEMGGGWVLEVDIRKFFDTLDHERLREVLSRRVGDGMLLRLVGKWLNAGVLEEGQLSYPERGTPQGGVISPLLANIYLHDVLDGWWKREVAPRLRGRARLVRYADDFVIIFEREDDARRVWEVLPKRFEKYGLALHPEKTRLLDFRRPSRDPRGGGGSGGGSRFDLLGFTHFWGVSRRGKWVVERKTASTRFSRALKGIAEWCRTHRHEPVAEQSRMLGAKLRGHYGYYGISWNSAGIKRFAHEVAQVWRKWLDRRSQRAAMNWDRMNELLRRHPLPPPRLVQRHAYT